MRNSIRLIVPNLENSSIEFELMRWENLIQWILRSRVRKIDGFRLLNRKLPNSCNSATGSECPRTPWNIISRLKLKTFCTIWKLGGSHYKYSPCYTPPRSSPIPTDYTPRAICSRIWRVLLIWCLQQACIYKRNDENEIWIGHTRPVWSRNKADPFRNWVINP